MQHITRIMTKIITLISIVSFTSSAFATGATITFGSLNPTSVPTLSTTMLIILSLLLFVVAVKISRQKGSQVSKFFVLIIGVGALVTGTESIKLLSNAKAGGILPSPAVDLNSPTTITIPGFGFQQFRNNTGGALSFTITADFDSDCNYNFSPIEITGAGDFGSIVPGGIVPTGGTNNDTIDTTNTYLLISCRETEAEA